jgi:CRP-like cAMP-binding protein
MEPFALQSGTLLGHARSVTDFSYFIESGIVSLVATTQNGSSVEVALIGREGVAGIADALGNQPLPYGLVVQMPGLRIACRRRSSASTSCRAARCMSC